MKKILILLAAVMLLFSGCIAQNSGNQSTGNQNQNTGNTVKTGDNVSVDYTGSVNGKIFDTSIDSVAKENNLSVSNRTYKPIQFTVGKGQFIKGFEEGIIGMKLGESKMLTIPPEKGYGPKNPLLIQTIPVIQRVPIVRTFPKVFEIPYGQFTSLFGPNHKIGDSVRVPGTNANISVLNISTTTGMLVSYELSLGSNVSSGVPWNDTVIKIDDKNITVKSQAEKNETFNIGGAPWNTTVIDVDATNMTMMHNRIPDTIMQNGLTRVHFNDTYITLDQNNELAGETLVFNVTVRSIN
jgi:FKBP-type peptidyl-prolyl cis-trans isomerase 2